MSGPTITRIPGVVDALLELLRDALPDEVQVADGPTIGVILQEALCVGFSEATDSPGYQATLERSQGMGRPRFEEQFEVRCFLTVASGDTDDGSVRRARTRCAEHLVVIDGALRDAHVTGGAWDRAALGPDMRWTPVVDSEGTLCNVFFSIVGASLL
ncbi:hypothetical protein [Actinotalea sp. JY-7876]|uniref:hypothetical protein n=1 Tax=Actinotalea sp. JY-7876 TaxID=2758442 RepID=UPI0015F6441C|nr:hypothetical protein [Actinotalea sp. JY-7876]